MTDYAARDWSADKIPDTTNFDMKEDVTSLTVLVRLSEPLLRQPEDQIKRERRIEVEGERERGVRYETRFGSPVGPSCALHPASLVHNSSSSLFFLFMYIHMILTAFFLYNKFFGVMIQI